MHRLAVPADLRDIRAIEIAAGEDFRMVGLGRVADDPPITAADFDPYLDRGDAWVTVADGGHVIAYLLLDTLDTALHVEQVTVHPAQARRGHGAALIALACATAVSRGLPAITLTTFREVPWNAPYYARLGFVEVPVADRGPELSGRIAAEAEHRWPWPRVAMARKADSPLPSWPAIEPLESARLRLEPLSVDHAEGMATALSDAALYEFTGGSAPTVAELVRRYTAQCLGGSPDGAQRWLNWIIVPRDRARPVGYVQASIERAGDAVVADIAWVVCPAAQRMGIASEAAAAMTDWLREAGVERFTASILPDHYASMGVARRLGLHATSAVVDGEVVWES